tara:strand:- start:2994 stop:4175 length:1182 start_codon:yes stop_codon:yes gene_type:complete
MPQKTASCITCPVIPDDVIHAPTSNLPKKIARRLLLSISLLAFSTGSLPRVQEDGLIWLEAAQAAGGSPQELFADLAPLEDDDLARQRGGFSAGGFDIDVGVTVTTTIDGFVEVSTSYSYTSPDGLVHLGSDVKTLAQDLSQNIKAAVSETVADAQQEKVEVVSAAAATVAALNLAVEESNSYDNNMSASEQATAPSVAANTSSPDQGGSPVLTLSSAPSSGVAPSSGAAPAPVAASSPTSSAPPAAEETGIKVTVQNTSSGPTTTPVHASAAAQSEQSPTSPVPMSSEVTPPQPATTPSPAVTTAAAVPAPTASQEQESPVPHAPVPTTEIIHQNGQGHTTVLTNTQNGMSIRQTITYNITLQNFSQIQKFSKLQNSLTHLARHISLFSLRH